MPIQDGNYVAPEWKNGQPPAINASELNDISETLENDWRRGQVLTPNTAQVFGLDENATPDQVFGVIANQFGHTVNVTVTLDGSPIEGVTIQGIQSAVGGSCITDASGKTSGTCATTSTQLTAISNWVDVNNYSRTVDTSEVSTDVTFTMTSKRSGKVEVTTSKTIKFSPSRTNIQYFIVGGGRGGSLLVVRSNKLGISGAGGAYTATGTITNDSTDITVTIGTAGGGNSYSETNVSNGIYVISESGGTTTISGSFGTYSANTGNSGKADYSGTNEELNLKGGNGGSGGGAASVGQASSSRPYAGDGGENGSDGGDANTTNGGTGSGNTTFNGVVYSGGSGGIAYSYYYMGTRYAVGSSGNGAGKNIFTDVEGTNPTPNNATTPGSAGGNLMIRDRPDGSTIYKTAKGGDGIAIFKWTT